MFVRAGGGLRAAARKLGCAPSTALFWVKRAHGHRLDRMDWADRPSGPHAPVNRTVRAVERRVVALRRRLARDDPLGYVGAEAIRRHLLAQGRGSPSVRTIGRILQRAGVTPQKRRRHPPPPLGWYLPIVACAQGELDQLDVIEGLHLRGAGAVETLTGISLWGKLVLAQPTLGGWKIDTITAVLIEHWRQWGAPDYLQMDNDTRFAGSSRALRRLGRFIRFCLREGVVPVFAPPRETGFQAAVESFNGLWQAKVWQRFRHRDLQQLRMRNQAFLDAHRALPRLDSPDRAGARRKPVTQVIFLRRTDAHGRIRLLDALVCVGSKWPHRLVRAELDAATQTLQIYALRRRDPTHQPLLKSLHFELLGGVTF